MLRDQHLAGKSLVPSLWSVFIYPAVSKFLLSIEQWYWALQESKVKSRGLL